MADLLREQGNRAIKLGNYEEADRLYTQAIIQDPKNYKLYTNRAFGRLKTKDWDGAAQDAEAASRLNPSWMKAYRHAAVAYGHLGRHDDAVAAATQAFTICIDTATPNTLPTVTQRGDLQATSELVLAARKARWDARERARVVGSDPLLSQCIDMLWSAQEKLETVLDKQVQCGNLSQQLRDEGVEEGWQDTRRKETALRDVFALKDPKLKKRHIPDCFIDPISFNFMVDPVITKSGTSYERAHLMEHLSHKATDPLTGMPLDLKDLRPNLGLREACEAFLNENEWAADF